MSSTRDPGVRTSRAIVVTALIAVGVAVGGCGSGKSASASVGSATDACAPLLAIKNEATQILSATPASTSPTGSTPSATPVPGATHAAARAITALAPRITPVADQLDTIASAAGTFDDDEVSGLLTAELALRRVALSLTQKKYTEASIASEDFHNAAKSAGLTCASPLGDNTRVEMSSLPTH